MFLAEVPAAPVVVEGGALAALTGALLLALLTWATLFGLQQFYTYTLGALLEGLKRLLNLPFGIHLGSATVGKVDDFVQRQIGRALSEAETNVARTWHALAYVARLTAYTVELLAHSTLTAFHNLTRSEIPTQIVGNVVPRVVKLSLAVASLGIGLAALRIDLLARVGALEHDAERLFGRAWQGIDHLRADTRAKTKALAGGVAAELGALNRYTHGALNHRLTKVEKAAGGAALAGAVVATVARFWPWLRCSNTKKMGKAVCRMDGELLDALLDSTLMVFGTISLLEFAHAMQSVTDESVGAVRGFIRETSE